VGLSIEKPGKIENVFFSRIIRNSKEELGSKIGPMVNSKIRLGEYELMNQNGVQE